jgi:hypothetical protein
VVNEEAAAALFGRDTVGRPVLDPAGFPVVVIGVVAQRRRTRPTIYRYHADHSGPASERSVLETFRAPIVSKLDRADLDANVVSPSYFTAMGLSLAAGEIFPDESTARGCRVAVVNQEAADDFFQGNAVGAAVIDDAGRRTAIIGVVHAALLGTFQRHVEPAIYFPMVRDYLPRMTLILGSQKANDVLLAEVRRKIEPVPGHGPVPLVVKTLEAHLGQTALAPLRIASVILGASAATALFLSVLGLYGALNDAARKRGRELAVRIALGARRRDVIGQVLREGGRLAAAGTLAGLLGSLLLSRLVTQITPGNGSPTVWVWLAGPVVLAGAVAIASVLPARRASMVDPLRILREEN